MLVSVAVHAAKCRESACKGERTMWVEWTRLMMSDLASPSQPLLHSCSLGLSAPAPASALRVPICAPERVSIARSVLVRSVVGSAVFAMTSRPHVARTPLVARALACLRCRAHCMGCRWWVPVTVTVTANKPPLQQNETHCTP